jgi:Ty3 transposon capsid-like protein
VEPSPSEPSTPGKARTPPRSPRYSPYEATSREKRRALKEALPPVRTHSLESIKEDEMSTSAPQPRRYTEEEVAVMMQQAVDTVRQENRNTATIASASKDLDLGKVQLFDGNPLNTKRFLQDCALRFALKRDVFNTDEKKIGFILTNLTGEAAKWKESYLFERLKAPGQVIVPEDGYDGFTTRLLEAFSDPHKVDNALKELTTCKQGRKSIDQHNVRFRNLVDAAQLDPTTNSSMLVNLYQHSLDPKVAERILLMDSPPVTLDDWYKSAARFANAFERLNRGQWVGGSRHKSNFGQNNQQRPRPQRDPNAMDVDAMSVQEQGKKFRDGACFGCGETGHYLVQCPKRNQKKQQKQPQKPRQQQQQQQVQRQQTTQKTDKKWLKGKDLKAHLRSIIVDNIGENPDDMEEFLDLIEEEGF